MNLQTIILAAGQGTRLGFTKDKLPKSLVEIKPGSAYLGLQLDSMDKLDFTQRVIVGGFGYERLQAFVNKRDCSKTMLVNNTDYQKGNLYSLLAAKPYIQESFVLFNADHFYSDETYQKIFSMSGDQITIFCDRDRNLTDDDMKVKESRSGDFVQMAKTLKEYDSGYVGVTYVPQHRQEVYWKACDATARELQDKAHVEHVLNSLVGREEPIQICDISGSWWTEIDTPEDLESAKRMIGKVIK